MNSRRLISKKFYWLGRVLLVGLLGGCASLTGGLQPPVVTVAGLQPLPSEGLAPRFNIVLDIQNRNSESLSIQGIDFDLEVDGRRFASGVSAMNITLQPLAQTTAEVPVTVNGLSVALQVLEWLQTPPDKLRYGISGHLHLNQGLRRRLAFSRDGEVSLKPGGDR